jgi:hypothetical protein
VGGSLDAPVILGVWGDGGRYALRGEEHSLLPHKLAALASTPEKTYDVCMTYNAASDSLTT